MTESFIPTTFALLGQEKRLKKENYILMLYNIGRAWLIFFFRVTVKIHVHVQQEKIQQKCFQPSLRRPVQVGGGAFYRTYSNWQATDTTQLSRWANEQTNGRTCLGALRMCMPNDLFEALFWAL